jgi:hypothetical protein
MWMTRYFFKVSHHEAEFVDENGEDLPTPEAAKLRAETIARELAGDGRNYRGYVVIVTDWQGAEIARVPVPDA